MPLPQPRNPLRGITLEQLLAALVDRIGWDAMGAAVQIRCFTHDPSIASSLKFLRRTPCVDADQKLTSLERKFRS